MRVKCCGSCGCSYIDEVGCVLKKIVYKCRVLEKQHGSFLKDIQVDPFEYRECYQEPLEYGEGKCNSCLHQDQCENKKENHFCGRWDQGITKTW